MSNLISRQQAIEALKICDNNEDGINCHKCPLRDERWDGAWQDDETTCYRKLMRDSAELLSAQPNLQPTCNQLAIDAISRQAVLDMLNVGAELLRRALGLTDVVGDERVKYEMELDMLEAYMDDIKKLPSVQPEYEAVKVEDFAKTMSENTIYSFKAWHSMALVELMERQGFVICKKTT